MNRYLIATLFVLGLILIYQIFPINFFQLDLPQLVNRSLFNLLRNDPMPDESIVILNTGILDGSEIKSKIDNLLTHNPKKIAINLCDIRNDTLLLSEAYAGNSVVIVGNCSANKDPSSRLIYEGNIVTHFKTDRSDYIEIKMTDASSLLKDRGNDLERINYYGSFYFFQTIELYDIQDVLPESLNDKLVLIGYCGSSFDPQSMEDFKSARITPMNNLYMHEECAPDMYDIQISANIIRMINDRNFINEISQPLRVGFIFFSAMLLVLLITIIRTPWLLLDLIIYFVCYSLIIMGATALIVYAFDNNYYLEVPELSIVLTVIGIFTVLYNLSARKKLIPSQLKTSPTRRINNYALC